MILFLYGEDSFRSLEELAVIKNKFLEKGGLMSALSVIDYEENNSRAKLSAVAVSSGLFSSRQMVIAKNLISAGSEDEQAEVLEFLKKKKEITGDKETIVVFWESSLPKKTNKLFKFFTSGKNGVEFRIFEALEGIKLENWIKERINKTNTGTEISKNASGKLAAYAGDNLFQLNNEIEKLVNFKEKGRIEEEDVELLVKAKIDANIFATVEALSSGNKKTALKLLHNQIQEGGDMFYILSMYIYQFRNLLKVSEFSVQGIPDHYRIAKEAGLHPYVVQKALSQLRNFSVAKLKRIFRKLQKLDTKVKTGKIGIEMALDKFVAEI